MGRERQVSFPSPSPHHFSDPPYRDVYAWGGTILIRDAQPMSYFFPRYCIKSVQIEFSALAEPLSDPAPATTTPSSVSALSAPTHS